MKLRTLIVSFVFALFVAPVMAQDTTVKNPTKVTVESCIDHAQDTGHEIDIVDTGGAVIATLDAGDPAANADGSVTFDINVQPIKFGVYTFVVRATAGTVKSENSPASDPWERVPGPPGKPSAGK